MHIMPIARQLVVSTGAAVALSVALTACEPTNLYVGSNTVVGVNGSMNTQQTAGHLIVGYDRRFAAIVPKSVPTGEGDGKEAMAVLSCSELRVEGIFLTGFTEYLATGEAAKKFAKRVAPDGEDGEEPLNDRSSAAMTKFFSCAIPHAPKNPPDPQPGTTVQP